MFGISLQFATKANKIKSKENKMTKKRPVVESVTAADEDLKKISKEKRQKLEKRMTEKAENSAKSRKAAEVLVRIQKGLNADGTTYWRKKVDSGEAKTNATPVAVSATRRVISKCDNERKKVKFNVADIPETQPELWPESGESEDEMEVGENSNNKGEDEEIEVVEETEEQADDDEADDNDGDNDDVCDDEPDTNDRYDAGQDCAARDGAALDVEGDPEDVATTEDLDVDVGDVSADHKAAEEEPKEAADIVITRVSMSKKAKKNQDKKTSKKPPTTKSDVAESTSRTTGVAEKRTTGKPPTSRVTVKPAEPLFDKMQVHGKVNIYLYISYS